MPYLTLTLSGYPVDLPPDAAVALSYRANDLRNLESREAAFSETFTLPLTAQNVAVLGSPHSLDSGTTTPYRLLPAVLTSPGGAVLLEGYAILELAHDGYDVTLTDAVGALFALVGDRSLRELDLSTYDHLLTFAAVQDGDARTYQQGYVYALADTGALAHRLLADGILFYEVPLAVYYHTVLAAIVAQALRGVDGKPLPAPQALRLAGSLLAEPAYQAAVLPRATADPQVRASALARSQASGQLLTDRPYGPDAGATGYTVAVQFPSAVVDAGGNYFADTYFTPPLYRADVAVKVALTVLLRPQPGFDGSRKAHAELRVRDVTQALQGPDVGLGGLYGLNVLYDGPASNLPVLPQRLEYTVRLPYFAPAPGTAGPARLSLELAANGVNVTLLAGATIIFEVGGRVYPGGPVHLDAALPDLKQADFLKLACNQFNALIQLDPRTRTVRFDLFNDLERNRARAVDWSAKVDFARRPRLAFRLGDYAQRNTLAYAPAPDAYAVLGSQAPVPLGSADLPAVNATLPQQAEAYTAPVVLPQAHPALTGAAALLWLPFVAEPPLTEIGYARPWTAGGGYSPTTPPAIYGGLRWVPDLPVTSGDPNGGRFIEAGNAPTFAPVRVRTTSGDSVLRVAWKLAPYAAVSETLATVAHLERSPALLGTLFVRDEGGPARYQATATLGRGGLDFGALLAGFYPGLRNILARVQVLTLDVRLGALDIAGLDFTVPVRLDLPAVAGYGKLSCLGFVNLIDQYAPGSPGAVAVTLIVLGDPVPGLAPKVPNPARSPRRALADELAGLILTEDGGYIFLEA